MTDFLTTSDIADLLHVSPETVRLYARQRRIPFETTPGGHRRYLRDAVLDALGGGPDISIGPSTLAALPAGATQVNFDAPAVMSPMATEVAALASQARLPRPVPSGPANRVHAALMTWAAPVELPVVGGRR
jgi:excisionase family DNA binding protein